jgi:hypothetical protein
MTEPGKDRVIQDLTRLCLVLLDALATGGSFNLEHIVVPLVVQDKLRNAIESGQIEGKFTK